MATSKDWSAAGADRVTGPCCTRYFAVGDNASWCLHTVADRYGAVTVRNRASTALYVSVGPALGGTAAITDHAVRLQENEAQTFILVGRSPGSSEGRGEFSTWATDGANHAMDLTFEITP